VCECSGVSVIRINVNITVNATLYLADDRACLIEQLVSTYIRSSSGVSATVK
jgi:hypothetical protein